MRPSPKWSKQRAQHESKAGEWSGGIAQGLLFFYKICGTNCSLLTQIHSPLLGISPSHHKTAFPSLFWNQRPNLWIWGLWVCGHRSQFSKMQCEWKSWVRLLHHSLKLKLVFWTWPLSLLPVCPGPIFDHAAEIRTLLGSSVVAGVTKWEKHKYLSACAEESQPGPALPTSGPPCVREINAGIF